MKTRQEAAEEFADNKERRLTSYHRGLKEGFLAGCDCSDGEHKEFYGLVMQYLYTPNEVALNKIYKHLASFTEREQPKD